MRDPQELKRIMIDGSGENPMSEWKVYPYNPYDVRAFSGEIKRKRGEPFELDDREKERLQLEALRQFVIDQEREKRRQQEAAFAKQELRKDAAFAKQKLRYEWITDELLPDVVVKDAAIAAERMATSGSMMISRAPKRTLDPMTPLATRPQGTTPKFEAPSGKRRLRLKD